MQDGTGRGQGLAAQGAQQPQASGVSVEQVVQALMAGTTPEELMQAGVPQEIIMQAIQIIEQQMAQQGGGQPQAPQQPAPGGLASQGM